MRRFLATFEIEFYEDDADELELTDMLNEDLEELYAHQAEIDNVYVREI